MSSKTCVRQVGRNRGRKQVERNIKSVRTWIAYRIIKATSWRMILHSHQHVWEGYGNPRSKLLTSALIWNGLVDTVTQNNNCHLSPQGIQVQMIDNDTLSSLSPSFFTSLLPLPLRGPRVNDMLIVLAPPPSPRKVRDGGRWYTVGWQTELVLWSSDSRTTGARIQISIHTRVSGSHAAYFLVQYKWEREILMMSH